MLKKLVASFSKCCKNLNILLVSSYQRRSLERTDKISGVLASQANILLCRTQQKGRHTFMAVFIFLIEKHFKNCFQLLSTQIGLIGLANILVKIVSLLTDT